MIDRRVCVTLAVLLWSEAGRAQEGEFPIGAWLAGGPTGAEFAGEDLGLTLTINHHPPGAP